MPQVRQQTRTDQDSVAVQALATRGSGERRVQGRSDPATRCAVPDCTHISWGANLCGTHYALMVSRGHPTAPPRS